MGRQNHVRRALAAGRATLGSWLTLPSPFVAEVMGGLGFDWLVVDMEHGPIGIETAAQMLTAIAWHGVAPLVRVAANAEAEIKRALDAGAWGVVVPMVNSVEEAEAAVAFSRYPPAGRRSAGGHRRGLFFGLDGPDYQARANDEILVVIQAEHVEHVHHVEAILAVPGIDAVFIGPNDLAASLGLPPGTSTAHPEMAAAIGTVLRAAQRHGIAAGLHVYDGQEARRRLDEGFRFVALANDTRFLTAGARAALAAAGPR